MHIHPRSSDFLRLISAHSFIIGTSDELHDIFAVLLPELSRDVSSALKEKPEHLPVAVLRRQAQKAGLLASPGGRHLQRRPTAMRQSPRGLSSEARCNGLVLLKSITALASSSLETTSTLSPSDMAATKSRHDAPSSMTTSSSAPNFSNEPKTWSWPFRLASCKGFAASKRATFARAPALSSISAIRAFPVSAAMCRGVVG